MNWNYIFSFYSYALLYNGMWKEIRSMTVDVANNPQRIVKRIDLNQNVDKIKSTITSY
jgi:hypothetical protein